MNLTARLALVLLAAGCQTTGPDTPPTVAKGSRRFGIHITEAADGDYGRAFQAARATKMDMLPFSFSWPTVETPTGWDLSILDIANAFFGPVGLPIYLTLSSPINTVVSEVPSAFRGLRYDDPRLIAGFNRLLDSVRAHTPALRIEVLILGNEIDGLLGTDPAAWARYQTFFEATKAHAKQLWGPATAVGTTITRDGLELAGVGSAIDRLIAASDLASVTYYPINSDFSVRGPAGAGADFDRVLGRIADRPIYFQVVGYPTSEALGSSEGRQEQFAAEVFRAWDRYPTRIKYVGWLWLTDLSAEQTAAFAKYYGIAGSPVAFKFGEYLRTLGLRRHDGADKPGYAALTALLRARGW